MVSASDKNKVTIKNGLAAITEGILEYPCFKSQKLTEWSLQTEAKVISQKKKSIHPSRASDTLNIPLHSLDMEIIECLGL